MKKSGVLLHFRDNDTSCSRRKQPLKYKHTTPLPSTAASSLSGRPSFFSLLHTLFRFSLFCGLRRFALQLIISPLSPLFRVSRIVGSSLLSLSVRTRVLLPLCPSQSLFHHYYTRPYTAIMPGPRYTTQSAVMPAIKLN